MNVYKIIYKYLVIFILLLILYTDFNFSLIAETYYPNSQQLNPRVMRMHKFIEDFANDESGATAIEYGLIAALVSVAAVTALTNVGTSLDKMFTSVSSTLDAAVTP